MEPKLKEGQIVFAVRARKVRVGDCVIGRVKGQAVIKTVNNVKANKVFLAGNSQEHDIGWIDDQNIIGRVVWPRR